MPTIREVADLAGVSPATVSRVLNGFPHIRADVRRRVLDAIAALGYEPNRVAQRLRATHSRLVGILVADITNPFLSTVVAGMEAVFFENGFSVLMSNTNSDVQKELDYLRIMENEGVAGLAVVPSSENVAWVGELAGRGFPLVVIDRRVNNASVDTVLSDNVAGARAAVEHLIQLGHRRIGHIGGPLRLTSGRERYRGYQEAMQEAGLPIDADWVRFADHQHAGGYAAAVELLAVDPPPTAIFIENNMMTLGALNAIHDQDQRIPQDVAIVGFDDMPWAVSLNPPLTAVAQSTEAIGSRAAHLLLERINEPDLPARTVVVETRLVIRASCGAGLPLRGSRRRKEGV